MSRLTSTQVIERGDYLDPGFDPTSLTMPHLLSILTLHAIKYPTPYNKSKLVQTFNEEIKPHLDQFKRERLERESSIASSHGITDGMTGRSMSDGESPLERPPPRRSSRRLSRPPSQTPPPTKPEPPKRRRSSAGPSLSRHSTSRIIEPQEPTLIEESEPEDEPAKKVGRPRKSAVAAGPQGRRVSQAEDVEGYSDNNVFQSGAESSSPLRPSPNGKVSIPIRRPTRRGRTSLSAPPQVPSSSPFAAPPPSSPTFDPRLPAAAELPRRNMLAAQGYMASSIAPRAQSRRVVEPRSSSHVLEDVGAEAEAGRDPSDDDVLGGDLSFNAEVSRAIANGGSGRPVVLRDVPPPKGVFSWTRLVLFASAITLTAMTALYKVDSASIGYCYPGTNTNAILGERKAARRAAQECTQRLVHHLEGADEASSVSCTPLPLLPLPEPVACTPCPAHAHCTRDTVTCEQSFVLRQHPLAQIPLLSQLMNGMPGFGPVALPPSCVEDEQRRRNIGRLGVALEHYLALTRGQRLCMGVPGPSDDGSEAAQWGLDIDRVHDHLKKITVTQKKVVKPDEFESLFEQAITDLQRFGYIFISHSSSGARYIAAARTHLDLPCQIRVAGRNGWEKWRAYVLSSIILVISAYWARRRVGLQQIESSRVSDLVQVALDTLRNQELAHHTDPVTTPRAYLSSLHLRDLILQNEFSIPVRRRLWNKVERVVEGNTNVRASMEELDGGDESRVWRWVGGTRGNNIRSP